MVEINRKALQIFQFLWPMIFFVFFELRKRPKLKKPKETRTWLTTAHWVRKAVKCLSEIVHLCRVCADNGQKLFNMLLINLSSWNFSWSSRSKYPRHSSLVCNFPAHRIPLQWVPFLIWVLDHTPDIFYLMCCDKLDVNLYSTKLLTLLPLCAPA